MKKERKEKNEFGDVERSEGAEVGERTRMTRESSKKRERTKNSEGKIGKLRIRRESSNKKRNGSLVEEKNMQGKDAKKRKHVSREPNVKMGSRRRKGPTSRGKEKANAEYKGRAMNGVGGVDNCRQ